MDKLCGFVAPSGDKAFFFTGDRYLRYDVAADTADDGYPLRIAEFWPGLFESGIDAAMPWNDGTVHFFRGTECLQYDVENSAVVSGPAPITEIWPGLFESGIDAAILWDSGNAYFFSGANYQKYDGATGSVEPEVLTIADDWPGVFPRGIETALWWPSGNVYFFAGPEYSLYEPENDAVADGYPRATNEWTGLPLGPVVTPAVTPSSPVAPTGSTATVREYFPAFSTPLEARLPFMYVDIKGLVTTGIGNLIDTPEEAAKLPWVGKDSRQPVGHDEIVAEWTMMKTTPGLAQAGWPAAKRIHTLELEDAAIDDLVRGMFDSNERRLAAFYPGWAGWPADARLGAHSIAWSGSKFPAAWRMFNAAANAGQWAQAAEQSHLDETGNPGLRHRNEANLTLFRNAAAVVARGLDPARIYYPAAL